MSISSFNILGWGIFCLFISLEYIYLSFPQQVDLFKNICLVKNTLLSQNSLNKKKIGVSSVTIFSYVKINDLL